jgi:hypothetical protein
MEKTSFPGRSPRFAKEKKFKVKTLFSEELTRNEEQRRAGCHAPFSASM